MSEKEKTVREKADELIEQLIYIDFNTEIGIDKAKAILQKALIREASNMREKMIREINCYGLQP